MPRKKLKVTEVGKQEAFGDRGAIKLPFKAKDPDGKVFSYRTYDKKLFDSIVVDFEAEFEWEEKEREVNGDTIIDRKVTKVYVDGQPVVKQQGFKGGGGRSKSPEELALDYHKDRSMYLESIFKTVAEFHRVDAVPDIDTVLNDTKKAIEFLDGYHTTQNIPNPQKPPNPNVSQGGSGKSVSPEDKQKLNNLMEAFNLTPQDMRDELGMSSVEWFASGHTADEAVALITESRTKGGLFPDG